MTDDCSENMCQSVWDFSEETPSFREQLWEWLLTAYTASYST